MLDKVKCENTKPRKYDGVENEKMLFLNINSFIKLL